MLSPLGFSIALLTKKNIMKRRLSITTILVIPIVFVLLIARLIVKDEHNLVQKKIRVMTYNVHLCIGVDGQRDYQRVADIILRTDPDVVALQELDSATLRSNGEITIEELAFRTNMYSVFGPYFDFDGGTYGIGILSKEKPLSTKSVKIPGRIENRLLIAEFEEYIFCCTHFSGSDEAKYKSTLILNELFSESVKPVIFAGDLNAMPGSDVINSIETRWNMISDPLMPTFPSYDPQRTIDYIFLLKTEDLNYSIDAIVVDDEPVASDHSPVWAEITVMNNRSKRNSFQPKKSTNFY
jgi:endonuclease/exonuclease/phosphatase family metal-dependent hydrolase